MSDSRKTEHHDHGPTTGAASDGKISRRGILKGLGVAGLAAGVGATQLPGLASSAHAQAGGRKTLIKGGVILTMDKGLGNLESGDILIDGDGIVAVKPKIEVADAMVIDAKGMIVIPGLVDTHRHTWQSALRGVGADWLLSDYFRVMRHAIGPVFRPRDIYVATKLGALESFNTGVTTMVDWAHLMNSPEHADAAVQALRELGIRAVFAYGSSNEAFKLPNDIRLDAADAKRVRDKHFSGKDGLLTMALAPKGPDYSSIEVSIDDFNMARSLELPITVHVGSNGSYSNSVAKLAEKDLLGPDVTYVHCTTSTDEEMQMIADSGGHVSVSAEAEMHLGCGLPPIGRMVTHGIRPSLSSDVPSVVSQDMFGAMRITFGIHRGMVAQQMIDRPKDTPASRLTSHDLLDFATVQGAAAAGLSDKVGKLVPGMQADVALISYKKLGLLPLYNASFEVVLSSNPSDVDTVLVAGKVVKRGGQIVGIDQAAIIRENEESMDYLLSKAGVAPRPRSYASHRTG